MGSEPANRAPCLDTARDGARVHDIGETVNPDGERRTVMVMGHDIDYKRLPEHIRHGVQQYIVYGALPGYFLTAVIENNLRESFGQADETNRARMFDIVSFFYNEAPADCWGSVERVQAWVSHNGLAGMGEGAL